MTESDGLISEHHSHADLEILMSPIGREPHQIFITEVNAKRKKCAVICVCGKSMQGWPLDEALEAFERHHRASQAASKRWKSA